MWCETAIFFADVPRENGDEDDAKIISSRMLCWIRAEYSAKESIPFTYSSLSSQTSTSYDRALYLAVAY